MPIAIRRLVVLLALSSALLALAACGGTDDSSDASAVELSGEVLVFATASLTDAFEELGAAFEDAHPDVSVVFNFAGSQQLAGQIVEGAQAGVFASANHAQMDVVADEGLVDGSAVTFASNALAIAVEPGNPLGIAGLDDLADPGVVLVLAAEEVPVGAYTREALDNAGVVVSASSLETDVRAVRSKVALGEADAGIVYSSDIVTAEGAVDGVAIPDEFNVTANYPIATLAGAPNPAAARAFVAFVRSADVEVLEQFGFGAP